MVIEVEQKFRSLDSAELQRRLARLIAGPRETIVQIDRYFAHPNRDFAQTDEALRLRREGSHNYITYKGPKLDRTTKTRREIELRLPDDDAGANDSSELLTALGFSPVLEVRKQRTHFMVAWQDRSVEVALDEVEGLGSFVELEIIAEPSDMDAARAVLAGLAAELGLANSERRSYLELLIERQG
jgi:adenylate cyclase, class 2